MNRHFRRTHGYAAAILATFCGCARDEPESQAAPAVERAVQVVFPAAVEVDDATVNDFVRTTIEACASADYDRFRALWGASEEPFTREQFERGWQTARRIEIHDIQPMRHPKDGSILYYVHAGVELAPQIREPKREVVLLIVKRGGHWRLAKAPETVRKRVLKEGAPRPDTSGADRAGSSNT